MSSSQQDFTTSVGESEVVKPRTTGRGLRGLVSWAMKGGLAILDQGFISGSNFLVGILLARWLMPEQYGAYALAFSMFLLLSLVAHAILFEPMVVFGSSSYQKSLRGYFTSLIWIHLSMMLIGFLFLGGAALVSYLRGGNHGLPGALFGVALASPCILLFWLARRAYYVQLSPARAAGGAVAYCALLVAGLIFVHKFGLLSPFTAYLAMAGGSIAAAFYLHLHLWRALPNSEPGPGLRNTWKRHWQYGRWALASAIASWIPYYLYYPLLTSFSGIAQAGQLRALMNLSLPMDQTFTALSCLFLPYAARVQERQGIASASFLNRRLTLLYIGGAIIYWALLIPFKTPVFHVLYGGKYLEVSVLVPYVALQALLWSAAFGPATVLRAMESPESIFYARCAASVLSLAVGIPLTRAYGLWGVMWGITAANAAAFGVMLYLLQRKVAAPNVATSPTPA